MPPTNCTGIVKKLIKLNSQNLYLQILQKNPKNFKFNAGQFINLLVNENTYRSYSISTNPSIKTSLGIIASVAHIGVGATYLKNLKVGSIVSYIGPSGVFKIKTPLPNNLHFFATGTGIAPFLAMFYYLVNINYCGNIYLYFGIRNEKNLFAIKDLNTFKKKLQNFNYKLFISQPTDLKKYKPQRITSVLDNIKTIDSHFYLCGHPEMIEEIKTKLQSNGVDLKNIIFEKFTTTITK